MDLIDYFKRRFAAEVEHIPLRDLQGTRYFTRDDWRGTCGSVCQPVRFAVSMWLVVVIDQLVFSRFQSPIYAAYRELSMTPKFGWMRRCGLCGGLHGHARPYYLLVGLDPPLDSAELRDNLAAAVPLLARRIETCVQPRIPELSTEAVLQALLDDADATAHGKQLLRPFTTAAGELLESLLAPGPRGGPHTQVR